MTEKVGFKTLWVDYVINLDEKKTSLLEILKKKFSFLPLTK